MSMTKGLLARLRSVLRPRAAEARMEEEFRFHVEMETEANIARGMDPAAARRAALLVFGGGDRHRESMRDERGARLLDDLRQDVRFAVRGLVRTPVFGLVAVVTIAIGVGATTALFSLANAVLFRTLPVDSPDALVTLQERRSGSVSTGMEGSRIPYGRYLEYRAATGEWLRGLAAHRLTQVSLRTGEHAMPAAAVLISGNYFAVLGVSPRLGRLPTSDDEATVVLSDAVWQAEFGGAADVVGRTVHVDGRPFTVTAVAPASFTGTTFGVAAQLWIPHQAYAAGGGSGHALWVGTFGRLAPGVTRERAAPAIAGIGGRIPPAETHTTVHAVTLEPLTGIAGMGRRVAAQLLTLLVGAAGLVLLIANANVTGMLLARSTARRREIAVRLAIGARRGRLVRQLLVESLVLFLAGGALGTLLAFAATAVLSSVQAPAPGFSIQLDARPDTTVLLFALLVSVVPALLFGLAPALQSTRPDVVPTLRGDAGDSRSTRARSVFVVGQMAVAVVLLVTAGLFVRTLRHALQVEPGFAAAGVVVATTSLAAHGYDVARGRVFYDELTRRIAADPAVTDVALGERVLLGGERFSGNVSAGDADEPVVVNASLNVVDTAYFRTLAIPLVAGRSFTAEDDAAAPAVVIVNQTLAQRLWGTADPIGRRLREGSAPGGPEFVVIGVARDGRYVSLGEEPRPFAFFAFAQDYSHRMVLHVRTRAESAAAVAAIRAAVRDIDPNVAIDNAVPLDRVVTSSLFPQRFAALLVAGLGLVGLLLASLGVYGVLLYTVTQRAREFGIRIALGATGSDVMRLVLARSLRLALTGCLLGLPAAYALSRLLSGFVFGVRAGDGVTFVAVPALLMGVALVAAWQPVLKATRVDPIQTLRSE